jgi:hypothetical protein
MSPAMRKGADGELLLQLERLAERIERAELTLSETAGELRAIASAQQAPPASRGRPRGAKTKGDTPGVKAAREYVDLVCNKGMRPTNAARQVASRHLSRKATTEAAVFKAFARHHERLIDEDVRDVLKSTESLLGPSSTPGSLGVDHPARIRIDKWIDDVFKKWRPLWDKRKPARRRIRS